MGLHLKFRAIAATVMLAAAVGAAEDENVEKRITEDIEANRKGDFTVRVVDADGKSAAGVEVTVEMTRHAFGFGTCVRSDRLARKADEADTKTYKKWIVKLFNRATLGNQMKWYAQSKPKKRAEATAAVNWLRREGLEVHGHTMIWASLNWKPMPRDVIAKLKSDDADKAAYVRRRSLEHVAAVGRRYGDKVIAWDVVNEPYSERDIQKVVHPDAPRGKEPILVEWFRTAREADPDARLYVNDYHILVRDDEKHKDTYEGTIRYLLDQKAPLGGIGFQCHYYNAKLTRTPAQLLETLDRFAKFDLPFHISEFDTFGKGWGEDRQKREQRQAEYLRDVMRTFFSHPNATAFTMWGFWDGQHWHDEAPLFRKDWTPKPALKVYRDLVFDAWWTKTGGKTGKDGTFTFRGFYGDYRVSAEGADAAGAADAGFRECGKTITITLGAE